MSRAIKPLRVIHLFLSFREDPGLVRLVRGYGDLNLVNGVRQILAD